MSISKQEIEYVARLARIKVNDAECEHFAEQLTGIMGLVEQMENADTDNIQPLSHPQDRTLRLRPDEVTDTDRRDDFMSLNSHNENGLYLVPKVLE